MTDEERKEIAEIAKAAAHYVLYEALVKATGGGAVSLIETIGKMQRELESQRDSGAINPMPDLFNYTRTRSPGPEGKDFPPVKR